MYHLRLCKGLSYCGVVEATLKKPDVIVDDKAIADAALASGYFVLVDEEGEAGEPDGSEDKDPGKKLKDMTVQEMETCAAYHGISLNGLTKKADIITKISEELGVDPKDVVEYGSPTMQELMEQ